MPSHRWALFCGTRVKPPRRYAHVVWIWMENHSYGDIVGSPNAPFINSLIAGCGLATNLPQHHAREPAEIPRRGLGPLAGGAAALPVRLQPVGRVQHHGRQHLRTRAVVEGLRGIDAHELSDDRLRRVRGSSQPATALYQP